MVIDPSTALEAGKTAMSALKEARALSSRTLEKVARHLAKEEIEALEEAMRSVEMEILMAQRQYAHLMERNADMARQLDLLDKFHIVTRGGGPVCMPKDDTKDMTPDLRLCVQCFLKGAAGLLTGPVPKEDVGLAMVCANCQTAFPVQDMTEGGFSAGSYEHRHLDE